MADITGGLNWEGVSHSSRIVWVCMCFCLDRARTLLTDILQRYAFGLYLISFILFPRARNNSYQIMTLDAARVSPEDGLQE